MNARHLTPAEIISHKRDGEALAEEDIRAFVAGIVDGEVGNEQIAALTMAIWFQGLNTAEQAHLTLAIRDSGTVLQWPDLPGPVLDKHSTGGVGDMVSFIAGPVVAACGGYVPMISGRGLGHTGGTLDKLESVPGVEVKPDIETFQCWVRKRGLAIVGQTRDLAPADQRIYAVRDTTATVACIPLIVSSILGKKLCEGLGGLVMDIKVGSGGFMPTLDAARSLAREILDVSGSAGLPCTAVMSDMSQPLAWSAGNAVEMREVIDFLSGTRRHPRLHAVAATVAAEMLLLGGLAGDSEAARSQVDKVLDDGSAAESFAAMIGGQGGPEGSLAQLAGELPRAPVERAVYPEENGVVSSVDVREMGVAVVALGGGRRRAEDRVDPAVGLTEIAGVGEPVGPDRPLAIVHAAGDDAWERARDMIVRAFSVADKASGSATPAVLGREVDGVEHE